ncbi:MAG TPA: hypothetical protein DDX40_05540 [Rikenellaceae bacterium]|nr:hypothetical protein [Rikenellaceae bacterium]
MLHLETISPDTLTLLRKIQSLDEFNNTRLVGGTALAMQLGHRKSIDLDFFGQFETSLEELTAILSEFSTVTPISSSRMMRFLVVNGIKVDIVSYPYDWIDNPVYSDDIVLAGVKDIAAMKLSAITNRGSKKDFIDYYFLLKRYSLEELIGFYSQKYSEAQLFTAIKSLTYFEDAESDPMPDMIVSVDWDEVKTTITNKVAKLF